MIPTVAIRAKPFDTRNQFQDLEFLDLMIEPADFGFFELDATPLSGVGNGHRLDDLNDFGPGDDAFLFKLQKGGMCRRASFVGIGENAVVAARAADAASAGVAGSVAAAGGFRSGGRRGDTDNLPAEDPGAHIAG